MARVHHTVRLIEKVLLSESAQCFHLTFEVENMPAFGFDAGQFVSLLAPDARGKMQVRAYSVASAPRGNCFDLCVNRVEGGFFSNLLADMNHGDTLQMHGPHGLFTLREPIGDSLLISTGTGVAPMRGFIEWLFPANAPSRLPDGKTVTLVYGTRYAPDIYYGDLFEQTAARHPGFRYIATLSRAGEEWSGARGYVQQHVEAWLRENLPPAPEEPDPPQHAETDIASDPRQPVTDPFPIHAYICGLNDMVSANRDLLKQFGWHRKQIVFERYD
jgi:ferredoxin-NADP reductase